MNALRLYAIEFADFTVCVTAFSPEHAEQIGRERLHCVMSQHGLAGPAAADRVNVREVQP